MVYHLIVWNNKEFFLDLKVIGLPASLTIGDCKVKSKTRERKKISLNGSSDEIAEKLSEILLENM